MWVCVWLLWYKTFDAQTGRFTGVQYVLRCMYASVTAVGVHLWGLQLNRYPQRQDDMHALGNTITRSSTALNGSPNVASETPSRFLL